MTQFLQIHLLTSYPPSNLNRDDLGRPKTAVMGGVPRLRISSQSLKRVWRTSDLFAQALGGHIGTRTKTLGTKILRDLKAGGMSTKLARGAAERIASVFGKPKPAKKDDETVEIEQLVHVSPAELAGIDTLVKLLAAEKREPTEEEIKLLRKDQRAADIALFGRMLAAAPEFDVEAAAQVAHAITVHRVDVEDDFFSAVDDLNRDDRGAGHLGEAEFAAGLFYLYLCIDRDRLVENLGGDEAMAARVLRSLIEAAATLAPSGKQNSFASRAYASYVLVEKGRRQPRSLSVAFLQPVTGTDYLTVSVERIETTRTNLDKVYGPVAEAAFTLNSMRGEGTLSDLLDFAAQPLGPLGGD